MIPAVDTNILLDVLIPGEDAARESKQLLDEALADGSLVIWAWLLLDDGGVKDRCR